MATVEEKVRELEGLYAKAITPNEYHRVSLMAGDAAEKWPSFDDQARIMLPGYWARYYKIRKTKENDVLFSAIIDAWRRNVESAELKLDYGYLLSVVLGELERDFEGAGKMIKEINDLAWQTGNSVFLFRSQNARALIAMQKKDWAGAIAIFSLVDRLSPESWPEGHEAKQHFANLLNNRGLAKLNLSDEADPKKKRDLISSAIVDLWNAEDLYTKVIPPPLKHIDGIQNRLIMAAIRLLFIEGKGSAEMGQKAKAAFEAKNREEAKKIVLSLREITAADFKKLSTEIDGKLDPEVVADGGTMTFIGSIQIGLRTADEFLEMHKEEK